jgi:hypothetical protein
VARRRRRNYENEYRYEVSVTDWYVNVDFNEYAYSNVLDRPEFEESFYMVLEGRISSSMSKKCKKDMAVEIILHACDVGYNRQRLRDDLHTIGRMLVERANSYSYKENTMCFVVNIPTKSYENIRDYMTYKGQASVLLVGTELNRGKGDIYFMSFGKSHS